MLYPFNCAKYLYTAYTKDQGWGGKSWHSCLLIALDKIGSFVLFGGCIVDHIILQRLTDVRD